MTWFVTGRGEGEWRAFYQKLCSEVGGEKQLEYKKKREGAGKLHYYCIPK